MVKECEHQRIYQVGCPAHSFGRRLPVVKAGGVFGRENIDYKRPQVSNQHAGGCMQPGGDGKIIQHQPGKEANDKQPHP